MIYKNWEPIYKKILKEFKYNEKEDIKSAKIALEISKNMKYISTKDLKKFIEGKIVSICGAAIKEKDIKNIEGTIISADETTSFLLKNGIIPDIITTDIDGYIEDLIKANKKGSIVIIHAHGDNIDKIKEWLPKFKGRIMITTQSKPFGKAYNFGGFTDGDRAYCIAKHFNAKKIKLIGFDFENVVEKKGKSREIKERKLKWAKKIIEKC